LNALYIGIVHKDPDSCYGMSFPDAPGCFSAADDAKDIYAMAEEALTLWLEGSLEDGHAIPPTRTIEQIQADAEWRESLADATFLIGVKIDVPGLKVAA
jgi:predicted RNase H-like HicB family nuclease